MDILGAMRVVGNWSDWWIIEEVRRKSRALFSDTNARQRVGRASTIDSHPNPNLGNAIKTG